MADRPETCRRASDVLQCHSSNQMFHVLLARRVMRVDEIEDTNEVMGLRRFSPQEVRGSIAQNEILDGLSLTALCWVTLGEIYDEGIHVD